MAKIESDIGTSNRDDIYIRGRNLTKELVGDIDFTDMCLLQLSGKLPSPNDKRLVNAVLVTLSDHGITPSVIAARVTLAGAPESLQGAVASGLLGAGDRLLGTSQNTALMLTAAIKEAAAGADPQVVATSIVKGYHERKEAVPGLGHPIHTKGDPRTARLFAVAGECGYRGKHIALMEAIGAQASEMRGKYLPINAAGAVGAVIADTGWPPMVARSLALIARTAGLLAHLAEEMENPQGMKIWTLVSSETGPSQQ
jgi:citrate synthase